MKIFSIVAFIVLLLVLIKGYSLYNTFHNERYGRGWNEAAQNEITALASHQTDFLQDIYHLKHLPPDRDETGLSVVNDLQVTIKQTEDDPKSINNKTIHAHISIDALPELFKNETSTGQFSPHAEGDYIFEATRNFWPAPILFLPPAQQVHVQWRRE